LDEGKRQNGVRNAKNPPQMTTSTENLGIFPHPARADFQSG